MVTVPARGPRSLADHAAAMQKRYGGEKISNGPPPAIVPSGSAALDWALRVGGYQRGRLYEMVGPKDSGKTTLGTEAMISFLAEFPGLGVAYVNLENTFDPKRACAMGLDCSREAIKSGRWNPMLAGSSEEASDMARDQCSSGFISLVVIDSVGAMESDRTQGKSAEKAADAMGRNAKIITQMCKALSKEARDSQCTVLLINQPRANYSGMGGDISAGPKLMEHATTARIQMSAKGGETDVRKMRLPGEADDLIVSLRCTARVNRMKNGLPGRVAEMFVNRVGTEPYGPPGVDTADEYITLGVREKIITLGGAWYTLPDGTRFQGREKLAAAMRAEPALIKEIRSGIPFDDPIDDLDDQPEGST